MVPVNKALEAVIFCVEEMLPVTDKLPVILADPV